MIFGHHSDHNQPVLHHLQQVFAFLSLTQVKSPATCACSKILEFSWRIILCKSLNMETIFAVMNIYTNIEAIFQVFFRLYVRYCLSSISLSAVRIYAIYVNCIVIFIYLKSLVLCLLLLLFYCFFLSREDLRPKRELENQPNRVKKLKTNSNRAKIITC